KRSRRNHSAKFKARIALEALRGIPPSPSSPHATGYTPPRSRRGASSSLSTQARSSRTATPLPDAERRIRDLQAKVGELTMERDCLSGALGRFGLPSAKR